MENFINGYPGHEHRFRAGMQDVLGREKADYFFDKVRTVPQEVDGIAERIVSGVLVH
jgi:hypothetical protein